MRFLVLILAACAAPRPAEPPPEPEPAPRPRVERVDPLARRAQRLFDKGDLKAARALLERDRWFAADRARAALLLCGCRLAGGDHAAAIEGLREYLAMTTRVKTHRDKIATRLLRHHATGGGLTATSAEEAAYFGLYALKALKEEETARADLLRASREAPEPERALVNAAWQR